jgi:hypothetical protein
VVILKAWKKGAVIGALFIPLWLMYGKFIITIAGLFHQKTLAGNIDGFFMLAIVPMVIVHQKFEIATFLLQLHR